MREIPVYVKHNRIIPKRTDRNKAVNTRSDSDRGTSCVAIQLHGVIKHTATQWVLEDRNIRERRHSNVEGAFVVDPLQYFLNDGQACDDLLAGYRIGVASGGTTAKHLDPGARVNENHLRRLPSAAACSRSETHCGTDARSLEASASEL